MVLEKPGRRATGDRLVVRPAPDPATFRHGANGFKNRAAGVRTADNVDPPLPSGDGGANVRLEDGAAGAVAVETLVSKGSVMEDATAIDRTMPPLIVTVAPNGARRTKIDHPAIPLTADEIGREAAICREAGAAMIHLHVRDADGRHVLDASAYEDAIAAVKREAGADMLIQITTEAVGIYAPGAQMAVVGDVAPEAFSIALREILPNEALEPPVARFLAGEATRRTLIQYILYDTGDLARFESLLARGIVPPTDASVLYVLGRYTPGQVSAPTDLLPFLAAATHELPWAVCAFGAREAACTTAAAALGGHARVGFENNLAAPDGSPASGNAALVAAVATAARAFGRPIADPDTARTIFHGADGRVGATEDGGMRT